MLTAQRSCKLTNSACVSDAPASVVAKPRPLRAVACRACLRDDNAESGPSRRNALAAVGGSMILSTLSGLAVPNAALAALKDYNVDPDAPIEEVTVQLGTEDGQYIFTPSTLEFTMGRIHKLKLFNPSSQTHYFTALEFASKTFTILVLAGDPATEVKGAITEVALKAGGSATWVFIPMKPGKYPLRCTVKGHDAMVGQIIVKKP